MEVIFNGFQSSQEGLIIFCSPVRIKHTLHDYFVRHRVHNHHGDAPVATARFVFVELHLHAIDTDIKEASGGAARGHGLDPGHVPLEAGSDVAVLHPLIQELVGLVVLVALEHAEEALLYLNHYLLIRRS